MHACMHACLNTCMHAYMHACIYTYIHIYLHTYIPEYIHAYMHTCINTYTHACMHVYHVMLFIIYIFPSYFLLSTSRHRAEACLTCFILFLHSRKIIILNHFNLHQSVRLFSIELSIYFVFLKEIAPPSLPPCN